MRFAVKVVPTAVLGCAAALLVACGDSNGLLSGSQAGGLQDALASVRSACADGQTARAQLAAQRFSDRVVALPAGAVDRRLVEHLQEGASSLEVLIADGCTTTTPTTTTPTVTATTPTTTAPPTTTTTTPTEPTTPTVPPTTETTPAPEPPDTGGGTSGGETPGGGDGGNPGGAPPSLVKQGRAP
jgi:hypothetical protein